MATRKRGINREYEAAGSWIPYYVALGDHRSAKVMRFHQQLMLLEMLQRYQERSVSPQEEGLDLFRALAPQAAGDEKLWTDVKKIQRAQQRAVLYASKTPNRAPAAGLFWTRQGRTDVRTEALTPGVQSVTVYASSLLPQKRLTRTQNGIVEGKSTATQVVLCSGRVPIQSAAASAEDLFIPDNRQVELVVGATAIEEWAETAQDDLVFGGIAKRLSMHIAKKGITNATPPEWAPKPQPPLWGD